MKKLIDGGWKGERKYLLPGFKDRLVGPKIVKGLSLIWFHYKRIRANAEVTCVIMTCKNSHFFKCN